VGGAVLFHAPDVAAIGDQETALRGVTLYIGDGASIVRSLPRRRGQVAIGHASIRAQLVWLVWCQTECVTQAVFTHCGNQIVGADGRSVGARIRRLGREHRVAARVAYDGLCLIVW
jgi:hypothetical protein